VGKAQRFKKHSDDVAKRFQREEQLEKEKIAKLEAQFKKMEDQFDFNFLPSDEESAWGKIHAVASGYGTMIISQNHILKFMILIINFHYSLLIFFKLRKRRTLSSVRCISRVLLDSWCV
jgi:hypothetical protein